MAKCVTCVFHEKDKRMEYAWFLPNYIEVKTMHLSKRMENARGTFGHVLLPTSEPCPRRGYESDSLQMTSEKLTLALYPTLQLLNYSRFGALSRAKELHRKDYHSDS